VADGVQERATVVAFDLGVCNGVASYQAIEWYFPQDGQTFDPNNYINDCTGDYIGPENNPPSTPATTTPPASDGQWAAPTLTITPDSLGGVDSGMTIAEAQQAAGITFDGSGDGFYYPTGLPTGYPHLFVGGETVDCVGAESGSSSEPTQQVVTPEGFSLGGTVQSLLAIYGSGAVYEPAPSVGGMTDNAGYVVSEGSGDLVFVVGASGSTISEIAGGTDIGPNDCTG
jgi:hypothetical protein